MTSDGACHAILIIWRRTILTKEVFELTSLAARYWFVFLLFVIVLRSYFWLTRDNRAWTNKVKSVPSAGNVGEAIVIIGNGQMQPGMRMPVPREGDFGSGHNSDIQIKSQLVKKHHLYFRFEENHGLFVKLLSNTKVFVDNIELGGKNKKAYILHGSKLVVGDVQLKFLFFAGLGVPYAPNTMGEAYMVQNINPVAMQGYINQMYGAMYNQTPNYNDYNAVNNQYSNNPENEAKEAPYEHSYYESDYSNDEFNENNLDNEDLISEPDPDLEDFSHIGGDR